MLLLVTRPQAEGERTAAALRARGHDALVAPVLHVEAIGDVDLGNGPWSAVLMTSGNAARALAGHPQANVLLKLPVYAVGRQTAAAARAAGFADVTSADGDAADLADLVSRRHGGGAILYLAGSDRARDLPGELAALGMRVDTVVIYRAVAAETLPQAAREAFEQGKLDGVLHYSQRTALTLVTCARAAGLLPQLLSIRQYCLSPRVAEPLMTEGATDIRIAAHPDEAALIELVG